MSGVNLNIQVLAYDCMQEGVSIFHYMAMKQMVPVAMVMFMFAVAGVHYFFTLRSGLFGAAVRASVVLITLLYLVVTQSVLSYLSCTHLINGPWVLDSSPDIQCFSEEHLEWVWLFVIGIVVYVLGIPCLLFYIIVTKHTTGKSSENKYVSFLVLKYKPEVCPWNVLERHV